MVPLKDPYLCTWTLRVITNPTPKNPKNLVSPSTNRTRPLWILIKPTLPIGPKVVPFWGSYLEFCKVTPKRNYFGAYGYARKILEKR